MKLARMNWIAVVAIALLTGSLQAAGGNPSCCLCGKKVCVLEVSEEETEVTYFDVESKEICIPGIKLPWECKRRCGGIRKVCVLKEEKRKETVCKYDWSIKTICTSCCQKHGLKRSSHCAQVNRDDRVPFEYYTADLDDSAVMSASALSAAALAEEATSPIQEAAKKPAMLSAFRLGSSRSSSATALPDAQSSSSLLQPVAAEPDAQSSSRRTEFR